MKERNCYEEVCAFFNLFQLPEFNDLTAGLSFKDSLILMTTFQQLAEKKTFSDIASFLEVKKEKVMEVFETYFPKYKKRLEILIDDKITIRDGKMESRSSNKLHYYYATGKKEVSTIKTYYQALFYQNDLLFYEVSTSENYTKKVNCFSELTTLFDEALKGNPNDRVLALKYYSELRAKGYLEDNLPFWQEKKRLLESKLGTKDYEKVEIIKLDVLTFSELVQAKDNKVKVYKK